MAQAVDALGYIHPVTVGQCCAAWSWSIGATSLARLTIMMMMMMMYISLNLLVQSYDIAELLLMLVKKFSYRPTDKHDNIDNTQQN